tara:strand:+ start:30 stop:1208 length:1179 start_codon:yes stop_codon:yes gene_type:complete
MAFNFTAFLGGAATGVSDFADETSRKKEKQSDRDYVEAREQNIYNRNKRDAAQTAYDALAEELAVYYRPEQVADIMSNGNGAAKHAITKGVYYTKLNLSAAEHYTMPNNDIKNQTKNSTTLKSPEATVGSISAAAEAGTDTTVETGGMDDSIFTNRFTVVASKEDKTAAEFEAALLNDRLAAGDDPEKNAEVDAQEKIFLDLARKKAEAARENKKDDEVKEFYTVPQRENKIAKFETIALNQMGVMTGDLGSIKDKLKGTNTLAVSQLRAAENLLIDNQAGYQEVAMGKLIEGRKTIALNGINQYAQAKYRTVESSKIFQNQAALVQASKDGTLKPNDVYITFTPASTNSEGVVTPAQYIVGTYLGDMYKTIGVKPFQPSMYLGESYEPPAT